MQFLILPELVSPVEDTDLWIFFHGGHHVILHLDPKIEFVLNIEPNKIQYDIMLANMVY